MQPRPTPAEPTPAEDASELAAHFKSWAARSTSADDPLDDGAAAHRVHCMMLDLARLAQPHHISPALWPALDQTERYLRAEVTESQLFEALQDTWGYVTGLACGVGPSDGRAAQIVMACLEGAPARQTSTQLVEQVLRVVGAGVPREAALALLDERS